VRIGAVTIALLFPGQGSQTAGFLHRLPRHPAVATVIAEAAGALQCDPMDLDSDAALRRTTNVQLALVIAGAAYAAYLQSLDFPVTLVAGHSVGAFSAAIAAGALQFNDGLRLVRVRATAMEALAGKGLGMLAVRGLSSARIAEIQARIAPEAFLAAVNAPSQVVISGHVAALQRLASAALTAGADAASFLAVPIPAHCPLLNGAEATLNAAMERIPMSLPKPTYLCVSTARAARDVSMVRRDLVRGLTRPVLWHQACLIMAERGSSLLLESPPGSVLTGLCRSSLPRVRCLSAEDLMGFPPEIYRRLAKSTSRGT
jgi:malonate decarboxylase epsilon subunit